MKAVIAMALVAMLAACGGGAETVADGMTYKEIVAACDAWPETANTIDKSVADECVKLGYTAPSPQWNKWMSPTTP